MQSDSAMNESCDDEEGKERGQSVFAGGEGWKRSRARGYWDGKGFLNRCHLSPSFRSNTVGPHSQPLESTNHGTEFQLPSGAKYKAQVMELPSKAPALKWHGLVTSPIRRLGH